MTDLKRLTITDEALKLVRELAEEHGPLMFYQAGGCCEGTQPMCFKKGGFFPRMRDVCIGQIESYDFWVDRDLFEYWKNLQFEIDVTNGYGTGGFSLEIPKGKTFQVNYTLFTPEQLKTLDNTVLQRYGQ